MLRVGLLALAASGLLSACVGDIGDDQSTGPGGPSHPESFECVPGDPSPTVLPRLSRAQYLGALRDLAQRAVGGEQAELVMTALDTPLTLVPNDSDPDHARLDQAVSQAHVDGQYQVAIAFATQLTSDATRVEQLVGACATDADASNDASCLESFIRSFGARAHRRPVTDAELAFYRDEVFAPATGMDPLALRDVVTVMVLSPWFLYRVENEGVELPNREGVLVLAPHELAARLAFHFWDAPPDDALLAAAESGALETEEGYAAEIDRMLDDPRTRATFDRFFSEWFLLDDLAPLDQSLADPDYAAFVGADVPGPELRARVLEDSLDLLRYATWESDGDLGELFLSNLSFAKTDDVAALYGGVPLWTEGSAPQPLSDSRRAGILTRPAMLATGSTSAHPVLRGREIRRRVLCDDLAPPPPTAMNNLPDLDPLMGERARMEALTNDGSCAGCHAMLNPVGFNLLGFDGLGRSRDVETIFGADGSVLATVPIDTSAASNIDGDGNTEVSGAVELSERIVESGKPQACMSRHYFRFAFARGEDSELDGCLLESMRQRLEEGAPLREVLRDIAMSETFRTKKLAD